MLKGLELEGVAFRLWRGPGAGGRGPIRPESELCQRKPRLEKAEGGWTGRGKIRGKCPHPQPHPKHNGSSSFSYKSYLHPEVPP